MSSPSNELFWTIIGLILTIGGTFVEAFTTNFPWSWTEKGLEIHSLGVTYQIGAVLLTGCLGGKRAGALSQLAYVTLGLVWLPVFGSGGGMDYLTEPTFGYIIGFVPGAWFCGILAFRRDKQLEWLAISCLFGLAIIHSFGIIYLVGLHYFQLFVLDSPLLLFPTILQYSWQPLDGQLALVCAVAVLAYGLRNILFY
ncbi:BioY protein [Halothece sp. PCC 7418]|uniref:biotin transporter BioY n=1 Tax=Halothece sp. (strain PCC 7418) TaxID=65093 RepID=UPI0002A06E53|nr:biotin transporter BioY [Halothece sp. PCC 7418]AFZ44420.1 BioY protein [Halothece sp. PCC 7418]